MRGETIQQCKRTKLNDNSNSDSWLINHHTYLPKPTYVYSYYLACSMKAWTNFLKQYNGRALLCIIKLGYLLYKVIGAL